MQGSSSGGWVCKAAVVVCVCAREQQWWVGAREQQWCVCVQGSSSGGWVQGSSIINVVILSKVSYSNPAVFGGQLEG